MTNAPAATVPPIAEANGFTLVEEDDVAFSLALSREIHRLYGLYQDGDLAPNGQVWAGLSLTRQMVAILQARVSAGMPALRVEVAAAQVREMLAVMFDGWANLMGSRPVRGGDRTVEPPLLAVGGTPKDPPGLPSSADRVSPTAPSVGRLSFSADWNEFWLRQSMPVRIAAGLAYCLLAAVVLDMPIAVMALFSNHLILVILSYALFATSTWIWRRARSARRMRRSVPGIRSASGRSVATGSAC